MLFIWRHKTVAFLFVMSKEGIKQIFLLLEHLYWVLGLACIVL